MNQGMWRRGCAGRGVATGAPVALQILYSLQGARPRRMDDFSRAGVQERAGFAEKRCKNNHLHPRSFHG